MAPLSAADLRSLVRSKLLEYGLHGFVRIGTEGKPLLLTDALRRGTEEQKAAFKSFLMEAGFEHMEEGGILWMNPGTALLQKIVLSAEKEAICFSVSDWHSGLSEAESLAVRFLRDALSEAWTESGRRFLLEALRLPDPQVTGWPEADRLRPLAAELLRRHDRTALHAAGAILSARMIRFKGENANE